MFGFGKKRKIIGILEKLEELGYYEDMDPAAIKREKQVAVWTEFPLVLRDDSTRIVDADAELLSEGGVMDILKRLEPRLAANGVSFSRIEEDYSEKAHVIRYGDESVVLWDMESEDLDRGRSSVRLCQFFNEVLEAAGSEERLYLAMCGGKEQYFYMLTHAMYALAIESGKLDGWDVPQTPEWCLKHF